MNIRAVAETWNKKMEHQDGDTYVISSVSQLRACSACGHALNVTSDARLCISTRTGNVFHAGCMEHCVQEVLLHKEDLLLWKDMILSEETVERLRNSIRDDTGLGDILKTYGASLKFLTHEYAYGNSMYPMCLFFYRPDTTKWHVDLDGKEVGFRLEHPSSFHQVPERWWRTAVCVMRVTWDTERLIRVQAVEHIRKMGLTSGRLARLQDCRLDISVFVDPLEEHAIYVCVHVEHVTGHFGVPLDKCMQEVATEYLTWSFRNHLDTLCCALTSTFETMLATVVPSPSLRTGLFSTAWVSREILNTCVPYVGYVAVFVNLRVVEQDQRVLVKTDKDLWVVQPRQSCHIPVCVPNLTYVNAYYKQSVQCRRLQLLHR
jgi:hypothetical protein